VTHDMHSRISPFYETTVEKNLRITIHEQLLFK
jgi:hypothetical protein